MAIIRLSDEDDGFPMNACNGFPVYNACPNRGKSIANWALKHSKEGLLCSDCYIACQTDKILALKILLERIKNWDHMDTAADGPYWRHEIEDALLP